MDRLNQHGSFGIRGYKDEKVVTVEGAFFAGSRAEAAAFVDEVNAFIADGTEGVLEVNDSDVGVRRAAVYLMTPDVVWHGGRDVLFFLDMVTPDPRKYGDPVAVTAEPPKPGGGLVFPLFSRADPSLPAGVLDFGTPGSTGMVSLTNPGSADSSVLAVVTGPVGSGGFTITDTGTGLRMVYSGPVLADQVLQLDAEDGTVLMNGYADRSTLLTVRNWFRLAGGQTSTFLFEAPDSPDARLRLEVRPAWW